MSTEQYRKGYEDKKAEIAETRNDTLANLPERFVKSVVSFPAEIVKEFSRSKDEDRGRQDAQKDRPFRK